MNEFINCLKQNINKIILFYISSLNLSLVELGADINKNDFVYKSENDSCSKIFSWNNKNKKNIFSGVKLHYLKNVKMEMKL